MNRARRVQGLPRVDVLLVSLGSTLGLRSGDDQLAGAMASAGLSVEVARTPAQPTVRTMALTDFVQARAAAAAAREALARVEPRQIIYSTTTAALLWPRPGAIRFDALAQITRPGRHGVWQRRLEARRLAEASLLLPWDERSLDGASAAALARPRVVVPIAIGTAGSGDAAARALASTGMDPGVREAVDQLVGHGDLHQRAVAVTYAADARKKGLDRIVRAWATAKRPGEVLLVTGRDALPAELRQHGGEDQIRCVGRLEPAVFRALVRRVGVLAMAPRREDFGLAQLEALAEGARVVTSTAPGPYAALSLVQQLWPDQVVADGDDPAALGAAIRLAIDARPNTEDLLRATAAVAPWSPGALQERVERELLPALFPRQS